jgi:hypothetical protein
MRSSWRTGRELSQKSTMSQFGDHDGSLAKPKLHAAAVARRPASVLRRTDKTCHSAESPMCDIS